MIGKNAGNKKLNFETAIRWNSPKFELNDIGFLGQADNIVHAFWMYYKIGKPFSVFRNMRFNYSHRANFDFSGMNRFVNLGANAHAGFNNFWGIGTGMNVNLNNKSTSALRGGPTLFFDPNVSHWMYVETDSRKKIRLFANIYHVYGLNNTSRNNGYELRLTYRPTRTLELSLSPEYTRSRRAIQYVGNLDFGDGIRYITSSLKYNEFRAAFRANYTILPNLTIQYYVAPFISKGEYSDFKKIVNPLAKDIDERVELLNVVEYHEEGNYYEIDETGDGITDFEINKPDFVAMQFNSNLVARWEYIPGSELFFVWSQGTFNGTGEDEKLFPYLRDGLFNDQRINNTFLIKFTYRFLK